MTVNLDCGKMLIPEQNTLPSHVENKKTTIHQISELLSQMKNLYNFVSPQSQGDLCFADSVCKDSLLNLTFS